MPADARQLVIVMLLFMPWCTSSSGICMMHVGDSGRFMLVDVIWVVKRDSIFLGVWFLGVWFLGVFVVSLLMLVQMSADHRKRPFGAIEVHDVPAVVQ